MDSPDKTPPFSGIYEFGPFRLEARERRLQKDGTPVVLRPKVFDTLLLLVENAGHIVTKNELLEFLWPNISVEEGNLTKNIWLIRKALGETEGEDRYVETVPKAGYRFVASVRRVAEESVPEAPAPAALAPSTDPERSPETAPRRSRLPRAIGAAAVLALGVAAVLGWMGRRRHREPTLAAASPASAIPVRRSVAVLGFQNLSGRPESGWLSTAASEMISAEISAGEKIRLIPAENVARLAGVRYPTTTGTLSRETLARLRATLDADLVLSGSYVAIPSSGGEALRFDVRLQDSATGEVLAAVTETGNEGDLFALISSAGGRLRSGLGLEARSPSEAESVAAALPKDPQAVRLYTEGLGKLRADDALGARPLLEAAIRIAPDFGPAHEALSRVWSALGYDGNARDEADKSFRLAAAAPPSIRLAAEARLAETEKDWGRAESLGASIFRAHPDDLDAGLRLASAQIAGGRAREALATLSALARLRAPGRDDPRIDLARADAAGALSRGADQIAASRAAAAKALRSGSTRLLAEARLREAGALAGLGEPSKGKDAYALAAGLFRKDGDSNGEAEALIGIANATSDEGRIEDAEALYRQAQATFERIGNRKGEAKALSDLTVAAWSRGDVDSALSGARQVLAINRSINDPQGIVWGLTATGNALADQGDFVQALALQEEGVGISRKIGDDGSLSYGLASIADTFLAQGRLDDARRNYEEALALSKKLGDAAGQATHENDLGNVFAAEGKISEAEQHYERALAGRRALGAAGEIAESQMLIASLRNTQRRYQEAAQLAEEAARVFAGERQTGNGAISLANQARAELGLGKVAEARALCARARAQLKDNRQNGANLPVLVEAVRVEASSNLGEARKLLSDLETRTRRARWPFYVLEARRAAAEIEILSGRSREGMRQMQSVAAEAGERGFGLIVAEAQDVLGGSRTIGAH